MSKTKNRINTFCPKPFEHAFINFAGDVFMCCPVWLPETIGNITDNSMAEIWNSLAAQKIRRSILDGSFKYCNRGFCTFLIDKEVRNLKHVISFWRKNIIKNRPLFETSRPKIIYLAHDVTCNLTCPSCRRRRPEDGEDIQQKARDIQNKLLAEGLDGVEELLVGGGEVFSSRVYGELLQKLDSRVYPKLKIILITNGLLFTPETWNVLQKNNNAINKVWVSIDAATEPTYKLNRGGNFKKLLKNLKFISTLRRSHKIKWLSCQFVVQANNYAEMKKFVGLGRSFYADAVYFTKVMNWGAYADEEYDKVAVHKTSHPEHRQFLETLKDPIFNHPIVIMGNIAKFKLPRNQILAFFGKLIFHGKRFLWRKIIETRNLLCGQIEK